MKNVLFVFMLIFIASSVQAQEEGGALLSDLLGVQPVEYSEEGSEEELAEYQEALESEKAKMEDELTKLDEAYKKDVAGNIDDFNKVLEETDEQAVNNEKQALVTRVRTMTMSLKKNKKDIVQDFKNVMIEEIRRMSMNAQPKKEKEVEQIRMEYFDKLDKEYEANMRVLETFKKTKHLIKKPASEMSSGTSEQ